MATLVWRAIWLATLCAPAYAPAYVGAQSDRAARATRPTAVIVGATDLADANPITTPDVLGYQITRHLLFVPLLGLDARDRVVPRFGRTWTVDRDTTAVTVRLFRGLRWHDGRPVTAHDLDLAYRLIRNPRTASPFRGAFDPYGASEVLDDFTWRVRVRPHSAFLVALSDLAPVPRHLLDTVPLERLARHPFGTRAPMGNGPFRFVRRTPGQEWVFEANPAFPAALGGPPGLGRLVYRVVPDPTVAYTELATGAADLTLDLTAEQAAELARGAGPAARRARLVTYPSRGLTWIAWNTRRAPFDDARVRRALSRAVDRRALVAALGGFALPTAGVVPPYLSQYDPAAERVAGHDPGGARATLDSAGWRDRDGNGVREDATGRALAFDLLVSTPAARDAAQVLQAQFARVGVRLRPLALEWGAVSERVSGSARDFDAAVLGWFYGPEPISRDPLHCAARTSPSAWTGWCDPALDRLLDSIPRVSDRRAAAPLWRSYQRLLAKAQPVTVLYATTRRLGVSRRLAGVEADSRGPLATVARWRKTQ